MLISTALTFLVGHQDAERVLDLLGVGAAADVEEVGRLAARQLDDVHRRHRQAGAVDHAADRAIELDVVQGELRRLDLERILLARVAQLLEVGMAVERVVVEVHLGVERQQARPSSVTMSGLISRSDASVAMNAS